MPQDSKKALEITARGMVQGVGFRYRCKWKADDLDLQGFARNEPDGTVTVHVEGEKHKADAFTAWMRGGIQGSHISRMEARPVALGGHSGFQILG